MAVQQRSEETRAQILQAAGTCFAQQGYDATSVSKICRAAGVSKGAFYHHFPSKHDLFVELMKQWLNEQEAQLVEIRDQAETVPEGLRAMSRMAQPVFQEAGSGIPIFLQFLNRAGQDDTVRQALKGYYQHYCRFFAAMIRSGIEEGTLRPVDVERAAQTAFSLSLGMLLQGLLQFEAEDWEYVTREAMEILLKGLESR